jgi:DnaK suppressor protein
MEAPTPEQLESLFAKMCEERDRLRRLIEQTRDDAAPVALDLPIGRLSRIDAIQQQKMAEARRTGYAKGLEALEAAIARFERGTYGECLECGETIAYKRLRARPEALLCLECQEDRESR